MGESGASPLYVTTNARGLYVCLEGVCNVDDEPQIPIPTCNARGRVREDVPRHDVRGIDSVVRAHQREHQHL